MKNNYKIIILCLIILLSTIFEITGISLNLGANYTYIAKPFIWICIGIITFVFFKNEVIPNKKYKKTVDFIVLITALVYFLIYFLLGYVNGFANNPYDISLSGIINNLWTIIPVLYVREYVRFYMINNCERRQILLWTFIVSLLLTFVESNIYKYSIYFADSRSILTFILETFLPSLVTNLYLSYICYFSGYNISAVYGILPQIAMYILPILPDVDWAIISILTAAVPFFSYIYINYIINKMDKTRDNKKEDKTVGLKGWIVMIIIVALMICFGTGVFPVQPLVIASNSMYPKIHRGDIVIIVDCDVKEIKEGEVIRYRMDGYYVVHRVLQIIEKDGKRQFIMKGDNNNDPDFYPVEEYQFDGRVIIDIPFVGYPTLLLNELLNSKAGDNVTVDKGKNVYIYNKNIKKKYNFIEKIMV